MGKAKILGLIIDRREVGDVGAFDNMTDEQLVGGDFLCTRLRSRYAMRHGLHLRVKQDTPRDLGCQ